MITMEKYFWYAETGALETTGSVSGKVIKLDKRLSVELYNTEVPGWSSASSKSSEMKHFYTVKRIEICIILYLPHPQC